jgi:threonine aldolase
MRRKDFLKAGTILATGVPSLGSRAGQRSSAEMGSINKPIDFLNDGMPLSPHEYADLLMRLADEGKIKPDNYSNGGVIEELEDKFAVLLGKESAVFLPTGTLANHLAVRRLAGNNRRIIVQEQSHLYNDSGDCCQTLSGLNLIPLGEDAVEFNLQEVEKNRIKAKSGRVETRIGVIVIETPVRRQHDRMVAFEGVKALSDYSKENSIKLHLDGARLFVQAVHTDQDPAAYGELADTVYTSLWKCFNASSGAILAGSKAFTKDLFQERRMFGSSLPAAWAIAAVALEFADGFLKEYKDAWSKAEKLFAAIQKDERFRVVKLEKGSHIVRLDIDHPNPARFKEAIAKNNIQLPNPDEKGFYLKVNPSLNRDTPENLAAAFLAALKEAG